MSRVTGKKGRILIKQFENCARKRDDGLFQAYPDPGTGGRPWTIGWGSTGPDIRPGTVWTQAQCDARFEEHLRHLEDEVNGLIGNARTTQNQFDALISFAYNCGSDIDDDTLAEGLGDSTLLKMHIAGNYAGAQAQFAKWNKAGGKVLAGLTRRRAVEAQVYGAADGAFG